MKYDLVEDIYRCPDVLNKIRTRKEYAQNLYAAFCNMRWCPRDLWPALRQDPKQDLWSASWRSSGGIIAQFRQEGDYMDWYCSGMGGFADYETDPEEWQKETKFVPEGTITEEIAADLSMLGWFPVPYEDD